MTRCILALALLAACDESGSFPYDPDAPGDPDGRDAPPLGQDDTGVPSGPGGDDPAPGDDTGSPAPPAQSTSDCALREGLDLSGIPERVRVIGGEAALVQDNPFAPRRWEGCEVVRFYDAGGAFDCEITWTVSGQGVDDGFDFRGPDLAYAVELEVDEAQTSCPDAADLEGRFGVDLPRNPLDPEVTYFRRDGRRWREVGTFRARAGLDGLRFAWGLPPAPTEDAP